MKKNSENNHSTSNNHINHNDNISQDNVINVGALNINVGGITINYSNNFLSKSITSPNSNTLSTNPENNSLERINFAENIKLKLNTTNERQVNLANVNLEPGTSITNNLSLQNNSQVDNNFSQISNNSKPSNDKAAIQLQLINEFGRIVQQGNIITLSENNSLKCGTLIFTAPGKFENKSEKTATFELIEFRDKKASVINFNDIIEVIFDGSKIKITGIVNNNGDEQLIKDQCILQDCESVTITGNNDNIDQTSANS